MTKNEIKEILEKHQKWLNHEPDGERADFSEKDLQGVDLSWSNLCDALFYKADLSGANLYKSNLSGAGLDQSKLVGTNLIGANLYGASLFEADLTLAVLTGANLNQSNLFGANLEYVLATHASFCDSMTNKIKNVPKGILPVACPEEGSFIGYKKARNAIVKLEILEDSLRSSASSRKCRCNKARVLEIQNMDGSKADVDAVPSIFDSNFIYKVGEIAEVIGFNEDRWNECSRGIHFFMNRDEAVNYNTFVPYKYVPNNFVVAKIGTDEDE